jgi:hypothetical protein
VWVGGFGTIKKVYSSRAGTWGGLFCKADPRNRGATDIGAYGDEFSTVFMYLLRLPQSAQLLFPQNRRHQHNPLRNDQSPGNEIVIMSLTRSPRLDFSFAVH